VIVDDMMMLPAKVNPAPVAGTLAERWARKDGGDAHLAGR